MARAAAAVAVLVALVAAGCGGRHEATPPPPPTPPTPIVVEHPAPGDEVPLAFTVAGTASVYEATLVVDLRREGKLLQRHVVSASDGAPARGTFTAHVEAPSAGPVTVAVYSPSAADGSAQHEQDVHVTVKP